MNSSFANLINSPIYFFHFEYKINPVNAILSGLFAYAIHSFRMTFSANLQLFFIFFFFANDPHFFLFRLQHHDIVCSRFWRKCVRKMSNYSRWYSAKWMGDLDIDAPIFFSLPFCTPDLRISANTTDWHRFLLVSFLERWRNKNYACSCFFAFCFASAFVLIVSFAA